MACDGWEAFLLRRPPSFALALSSFLSPAVPPTAASSCGHPRRLDPRRLSALLTWLLSCFSFLVSCSLSWSNPCAPAGASRLNSDNSDSDSDSDPDNDDDEMERSVDCLPAPSEVGAGDDSGPASSLADGSRRVRHSTSFMMPSFKHAPCVVICSADNGTGRVRKHAMSEIASHRGAQVC